jgi:hypothetical protein
VIREATEPQPECGPIGYAGAEIDLLAKATNIAREASSIASPCYRQTRTCMIRGRLTVNVNAQRKSRLTAAFNYEVLAANSRPAVLYRKTIGLTWR